MRKIDRVQAGTVRKNAKQISAVFPRFQDLKDQKCHKIHSIEDDLEMYNEWD